MKLGEFVEKYISEHKISQRQFAKRCGMSSGYISMIVNGVNPRSNTPIVPTLKSLNGIARGMNITIDELFAENHAGNQFPLLPASESERSMVEYTTFDAGPGRTDEPHDARFPMFPIGVVRGDRNPKPPHQCRETQQQKIFPAG